MNKTTVNGYVIEVCLLCQTTNKIQKIHLKDEKIKLRCRGCGCGLVACSACKGTLVDIGHCNVTECESGSGFQLGFEFI